MYYLLDYELVIRGFLSEKIKTQSKTPTLTGELHYKKQTPYI